VVHTLDRLGRTVRDTLNLIHDLSERGVGVRNLADPIRVDSANPADPMAQLALVLLALFGQMERTYTLERAAHARSVALAKGRRVGRPVAVSADQLDYAAHLRDSGHSISEIVAKTGIARTSLYRHLPRPADTHTAADSSVPEAVVRATATSGRAFGRVRSADPNHGFLESVTWRPTTNRLAPAANSPPPAYRRRPDACAASQSSAPWPSPAAAPSTSTPQHSRAQLKKGSQALAGAPLVPKAARGYFREGQLGPNARSCTDPPPDPGPGINFE
jgi:hypothetical protein